jgi:hypothetical protein
MFAYTKGYFDDEGGVRSEVEGGGKNRSLVWVIVRDLVDGT